MANKKLEARTSTLNENGVETGKYFSISLPNGMKPGDKLSVTIGKDGVPVIVNDPILDSIYENGYVRNTKLHRRFVMAQMFHMLNYSGCRGEGYTDALKTYPYEYQFKMMLEEFHVQDELHKADDATYRERNTFFNKNVAIKTMQDHIDKAKRLVACADVHKCKGIPYKKVPGHGNVFVTELEDKVWKPLEDCVDSIRRTDDPHFIHYFMKRFIRNMVKLPWQTEKCDAWVDAFKGAGAFYTAKNLIMFHNCCVYTHHDGWGNYRTANVHSKLGRDASLAYLEARLGKSEGWELLGFLKELIADNNFDFGKRMKELGVQEHKPYQLCW